MTTAECNRRRPDGVLLPMNELTIQLARDVDQAFPAMVRELQPDIHSGLRRRVTESLDRIRESVRDIAILRVLSTEWSRGLASRA